MNFKEFVLTRPENNWLVLVQPFLNFSPMKFSKKSKTVVVLGFSGFFRREFINKFLTFL